MNDELIEVGPEDAAELVAAGAYLLDVREPEEWEAGHAPGANHIPLGELGARWGELPEGRIVVCVCRMGGRSARAAEALKGVGVEAYNLTGGMTAWAAASLPVVADGGTGFVL